MSRFNKIGLNKRERQYGLTDKQIYYITQAFVMPAAIKKEKEAQEKGVTPTKLVENMLQALLKKYSEYSQDEKVKFVKLAKTKYLELLEGIEDA